MRDSQDGFIVDDKENNKEIYAAPTITSHDNLRLITKDILSFDYDDDVDVPPPPPVP